MFRTIIAVAIQGGVRLAASRDGSVAPLLALALVPIAGAVGAAVDYSRAGKAHTQLQAALDTAVLAGARDGSAAWSQIALNTFKANVATSRLSVDAPTFAQDANGNYTGQLTTSLPTNIVGVLGISSMIFSVKASASGKPENDDSCILTLDPGQPRSHVSMRFDGAPSVSLRNCSLRSNTSIACNGHSGGAAASIGSGTVSGCSNPRSYARQVDDIYAPLAENVSTLCGALTPGITWAAGSQPPASVKTATRNGYTEYHVCGDLTLEGEGSLFGSTAASDTVIVVENGSIILAEKSAISLSRVALVMAGSNQAASSLTFPNGEGKAATLSLSPPTEPDNPWRGISLYQHPALSKSTEFDWSPGATIKADGVIYLPNANLVMRGNAGSGNTGCTKFVAKTFTTNGNVSLNFSQSKDDCTALNMQQWSDVPVHLVR